MSAPFVIHRYTQTMSMQRCRHLGFMITLLFIPWSKSSSTISSLPRRKVRLSQDASQRTRKIVSKGEIESSFLTEEDYSVSDEYDREQNPENLFETELETFINNRSNTTDPGRYDERPPRGSESVSSSPSRSSKQVLISGQESSEPGTSPGGSDTVIVQPPSDSASTPPVAPTLNNQPGKGGSPGGEGGISSQKPTFFPTGGSHPVAAPSIDTGKGKGVLPDSPVASPSLKSPHVAAPLNVSGKGKGAAPDNPPVLPPTVMSPASNNPSEDSGKGKGKGRNGKGSGKGDGGKKGVAKEGKKSSEKRKGKGGKKSGKKEGSSSSDGKGKGALETTEIPSYGGVDSPSVSPVGVTPSASEYPTALPQTLSPSSMTPLLVPPVADPTSATPMFVPPVDPTSVPSLIVQSSMPSSMSPATLSSIDPSAFSGPSGDPTAEFISESPNVVSSGPSPCNGRDCARPTRPIRRLHIMAK